MTAGEGDYWELPMVLLVDAERGQTGISVVGRVVVAGHIAAGWPVVVGSSTFAGRRCWARRERAERLCL